MTEPRDLGLHLPIPGVTNIYYLTGLFHVGSGEGTWVLVLASNLLTGLSPRSLNLISFALKDNIFLGLKCVDLGWGEVSFF